MNIAEVQKKVILSNDGIENKHANGDKYILLVPLIEVYRNFVKQPTKTSIGINIILDIYNYTELNLNYNKINTNRRSYKIDTIDEVKLFQNLIERLAFNVKTIVTSIRNKVWLNK